MSGKTPTTIASLPAPPAWASTTTPIELGREFSAGFGDVTPDSAPRFPVELVQSEYIDSDAATIRRDEPRLYVGGDSYSPDQAADLAELITAALAALRRERAKP